MKLQNIIILALFLIDSNCNAQHKPHETIATAKDSMISLSSNNKPMDFNAKFNALLLAYIQLKNALVNTDANAASTAGKLIIKAIEAIDTKNFTSKQLLNWTMYAEKISYDAEHVKSTPETEHQREHFISLSKNLYELAKVFNANTEDLYYQFCPMANDGKGAYWLSEQSKIRNPYYGKKMLSCGSTKETLPAAK